MGADYLYVCSQGSSLSLRDNRVLVQTNGVIDKDLPAFPIKVIELFGNVQVSTPLIRFCLQNGITIAYYTMGGSFCGMLQGTDPYQTIENQCAQTKIQEDGEFCRELASKMLSAKIHNQETLIRRYLPKEQKEYIRKNLSWINKCIEKMKHAKSNSAIMGYEGSAARTYFMLFGSLFEKPFRFTVRSRRPAKDPVNAFLNLGYSMLCKEVTGKILDHRLSPAFGILHGKNDRKLALSYDLMEEWRAVIIDSLVISMFNGHEIKNDCFEFDEVTGSVRIDQKGIKIFLRKYALKMETEQKYITPFDRAITYREALYFQVKQLGKALVKKDASLYKPIMIR